MRRRWTPARSSSPQVPLPARAPLPNGLQSTSAQAHEGGATPAYHLGPAAHSPDAWSLQTGAGCCCVQAQWPSAWSSPALARAPASGTRASPPALCATGRRPCSGGGRWPSSAAATAPWRRRAWPSEVACMGLARQAFMCPGTSSPADRVDVRAARRAARAKLCRWLLTGPWMGCATGRRSLACAGQLFDQVRQHSVPHPQAGQLQGVQDHAGPRAQPPQNPGGPRRSPWNAPWVQASACSRSRCPAGPVRVAAAGLPACPARAGTWPAERRRRR